MILFNRIALKTDRTFPLEDTNNGHLMPLSDYFRADQKLKQITKSPVHMPGEGDADLFSLVASDKMHGGGSELCPETCRLDIRKRFPTQGWWMVSHCNKLPKEVVSALSQSVGLILYLLSLT